MGRICQMAWEGEPNYRWVKMRHGVRYRVHCGELGLPQEMWTKEGSYHAANLWWEGKLAELLRPQQREQELLNHLPPDELDRLIEQGRAAEQLKRARGANDQCPQLASKDEVIATVIREDGHTNLRGLAHLVGKASGNQPETDRTLNYQAQRFLALELARGKKPLTYADLSAFVGKIIASPCLPGAMDAGRIDAATVGDFYAWLRTDSGMRPSSQKKCFSMMRRLVRFLWGEGLIELPKNLDSRQFTFDTGASAVKDYPLSQVRELLQNLPDRLKLYACLALNAGMQSVDIACFTHEELQGNRIVRKRTKTERTNVPTVSYRLWDETLTLLNKYPRTHPEYVLTSKDGTPLWKSEIKDGKNRRVNLIFQQWHRKKLPIPLKALRSHASNLLGEGGYDLQIQQVFLCHAPATMAERHYVNYPQSKLDDALLWLRGRYFA